MPLGNFTLPRRDKAGSPDAVDDLDRSMAIIGEQNLKAMNLEPRE